MKNYIISLFVVLFISPVTFAQDMQLSMLPRYFPDKLSSMINPLSQHLSKELNIPITPVLTGNFTEYENAVNKGDLQIGYQNPLVYVNVSKTHEVVAMALKGQGNDKFRGIIITRRDSEISSLKKLHHKKVMIVGETSAGGFLSQKITLKKSGIDVAKDCQIEVAVDNKQENVIIAVSIGDADVGFIRESAFHVADKYIQPGSIKIMAYSEWLPNWALSVNRALPEKVKDAIQKSVLGLEKGHPVLKAMGLKGFAEAKDPQYDILREILKN